MLELIASYLFLTATLEDEGISALFTGKDNSSEVDTALTGSPKGALWSTPSRFSEHALPTLMKKVAAHAIKYLHKME